MLPAWPEFQFPGCSLDMTREVERVLRDSDEGITKLRRRRSAEETLLAKARVADRREVAAESGDDPKSAANFASIRQLWFDYVDDWDLEIDPHEGRVTMPALIF